jgi:hypothetical protein
MNIPEPLFCLSLIFYPIAAPFLYDNGKPENVLFFQGMKKTILLRKEILYFTTPSFSKATNVRSD